MSRWGERDNHRRKTAVFNKLLNDESAEMRGHRQAVRFLEGMDSFDSKSKLLNLMLDKRKNGAKRVEEIISFLNDEQDVEELVVPLLLHGINPQTSKPLFRANREKYLHSIYLVPGFIDFLAQDFLVEKLNSDSADLICKFLIFVSKAFGEARSDESIATITKNLMQRGDVSQADTLGMILLLKEKDALKAHMEKRGRVEESLDVEAEVACVATDRIPPGDRHTNDHFNFRDISLVPPADELRCQVPQYLPLASEENAILEDPVSRLLDRNFRLLREDAVSSMRTCISEKRRLWYNARIIGMESYGGNDETSFVTQLDPPQRAISDWHRTKALNFQSVVAFLDREGIVKRTGIITLSRDDVRDKWLNNPNGPVIGISFDDEVAFGEASEEMVLNRKLNQEYVAAKNNMNRQSVKETLSTMKTYQMVEISRSFFAYQPILKALQNLDGIPFRCELLGSRNPSETVPSYLPPVIRFPTLGDRNGFEFPNDAAEEQSVERLLAESTLDLSQARAVRHVLTSRVALVQGPPGTGKTFIGGVIAQIILENSSEKILCVCYTNHALDQFLEHMVDAGKTSIVRLGARTKSKKLEKYQLRVLARSKGRNNDEVNQTIKRIDAKRYKLRNELAKHLEEIESTITWNTPNGGIKAVLEDEFPDEFEYLSIPREDFGFQIVGAGGKRMKQDYLWNEWRKGSNIPPFAFATSSDPQGLRSFWSMAIEKKTKLIKEVERSVLQISKKNIRDVLQELKELSNERDTARRVSDMQILKDASIIGATTSGAAKYRDILSEVSPGVIIVEEAGEVLESHILTSLSSKSVDGVSKDTKHLILIGDHKQLRPKVETYKLTKVARGGYNLYVSLFERLILRDLPSASLHVQHRMRPSISLFERSQTYPNLMDHESVLEFPNIRGVNENVVFIDHENLEDEVEADSLDAKRSSTTKSNKFEAELCVEIVRYFLLQGYSPEQIVVLTPYLGQLSKITRVMRRELKNIDAYISEKDLDEFEGEEQDELAGTKASEKRDTVRCSSVDNYQGEESDIVIASLVRCNQDGSIGFLKEPQRVNVLLSRARYGMFIVGSSKTLLRKESGIKTWSILFDMMAERGQIKRGLPTVCTLHPDDPPKELKSRLEFRSNRPNGGCDRPCGFRLPCGHVCPQMCHPLDQNHTFAAKNCSEPCRRIPPACGHQHPCTKLCRQACGPCRTPMGPFTLPCGHVNFTITCHETRSEEAIECFSRSCSERVEKSFPCGHVSTTTCANARSERPICPEECGKRIESCGHECRKLCHSCDGNHDCKQICKRTLFCGHICDRPCHAGKECKPCEKACLASCTHSKCPKPCGAPCASCVEECDWECEHFGKCELVCSAPCTRLPCNKRCTKLLDCGHRCPSVCGEPCPNKKYCAECGSDDIKSTVVDFILLEQYAEHDLDSDPVIFLPCGHFLGIETLDGHLEMGKVYDQNPESGEYLSIKSILESGLSDRPKRCPQCQFPITAIRRYGRILNYIALRGLERKHREFVEKTLSQLSQMKEKNLKTLKELRKTIETSPIQQVRNACLSLETADEVEVPRPSPSLLLKVVRMTAQVRAGKVEELNDGNHRKAKNAFLEAIDIAHRSQSWSSSASIRIEFVEFLWRWMAHDEPKDLVLKHLDWVENEMPIAASQEVARARELRREIVSNRKLKDVIAAMNIIQGYDYGGGASGHWYECPNGHPYYIGECGQAMETSMCIECNAQVGGGSHRLLGSNQAWQQYPL